MARNLTDEDIDALSKALGKVVNRGGSPVGSGQATLNIPGTNKQLDLFDQAIGAAGKGAEFLKTAYKAVESEIIGSMNTWRDLSKSGIGFNSDIIGMSVAAKGTRMDLGDFADMVKQNKTFLAGFGGSVSKGAEEFAKTSKVMFDQYGETTDRLRQMGYTNKDLNEVLALQSGLIGSSMRQGKERDRIAIESATSLATEMDLLAKMTGKSREEQMSNAKKLQADAAFNAKMEQATRNMSEKEAAEYKTKMMAEYAKAEAIGMGQAFKETYVYGTVMTKQAATEQAIAGKAGAETIKAAQLTAAGNFEEAAKRSAAAQDAAVANNKNANFQNMVIYGQFTGAVGEAAQKQYMTNKAMTDSIEAIKKERDEKTGQLVHAGKSDAELRKIAEERARKEQEGAKGTTAVALNLEARFKDAQSAIANSLVGPLNNDVNPALKKLSESALGARGALSIGQKPGGTKTFSESIEEPIAKGRQAAEKGETRPSDMLGSAGYVASKIGKGLNELGESADKKISPEKRSGGTLGMTGNLYEKVGEIIEITKPDESVLTSSQMTNMAKGMMDKGAEKALLGMKSLTGNMPSSSIDITSIGKDIGTTLSAATPKTIQKIDSSTQNINKVEVINWPKELEKIKSPGTEVIKDTAKESAKTSEVPKEEVKTEQPKNTQASVRMIDNLIESKKESTDKFVSGAGEFGEEPSLAFASLMDEFGSNFDQMISKVNTGFDAVDLSAFEFNIEQINKDLIDALPIVEVSKQQEAFKSQFTDSQLRLIDQYKNISEENRFFMAEEQRSAMEDDLKLLQTKNAEIERLTDLRNQRELTAEEEEMLAEETMNRDALRQLVADRQDQIDILENIEQYAADRKLEIAEQSNAAVLKANEAFMLELNDIASDIEEALPVDDFMLANAEPETEKDEFDGVNEAVANRKIIDDIKSAIPLDDFMLANAEPETEKDEFEGVDEAVASQKAIEDIKAALPLDDFMLANAEPETEKDEFDGVDEAVANQKIVDDIRSALPLDEFMMANADVQGEEVDEFAGLDEAIAKQRALTDFGEFAGVDEAIAKQQPATVDYDEFAGVDEQIKRNREADAELARESRRKPALDENMKEAVQAASPTANSDKFNLDSLSFSPTGMPIVKQVKQATSSLPAKTDTSQDDAETAKFKRQAETKKEEDKTKSETSTKLATPAGKEASLNDVVTALNSLNSKIGQLITKTEDLFNKQIQATKSNSNNIYART